MIEQRSRNGVTLSGSIDLKTRKDGWAISTDSRARKDNRNLLTVRSSVPISKLIDRHSYYARFAFTHIEPQQKIRDLVFHRSAFFSRISFSLPCVFLRKWERLDFARSRVESFFVQSLCVYVKKIFQEKNITAVPKNKSDFYSKKFMTLKNILNNF